MTYAELPKLKKNSVSTTLSSGITDSDVTIPVTELSVFYDVDSNLITKGIVIGYDNPNDTYAEEITITGASGTSGAGNLTGATRGVNADGAIGAARAWDSATNIAVMFSTGVYEQIRVNEIAINANTRELLTADRTYYVATTGNDTTGDGSSGNPWATIQHAYDIIVATLDTAGYTVTIQLADGTYTDGLYITKSWSGGGNIVIQGNISNMDSVIIAETTVPCVSVQYGVTLSGFLQLSHFKGTNTGSGRSIIEHYGGGTIRYGYINFGSVNAAAYADHIIVSGNNAIVTSNFQPYTISGNAFLHVYASRLSYFQCQVSAITLIDTPAFTEFARSSFGAVMNYTGYTIASGSATGKRYNVIGGGIIETGGLTLPGDTAGSNDGTGIYT